MTIEGRPFIGYDSYEKQRKCRMQDAVDDYLQDDKVSARQAYEEIISCVNDVIEYHKTSMERAVTLKELMMGHREVDLNDFVKNPPTQQEPVYNDDGSTSYGYAANITLKDVFKFQRGSSL
jgi:hypothetical protein